MQGETDQNAVCSGGENDTARIGPARVSNKSLYQWSTMFVKMTF
jgi:hypothetical protein